MNYTHRKKESQPEISHAIFHCSVIIYVVLMKTLWNSLRRLYFNYVHYNDRRAIWNAIRKSLRLEASQAPLLSFAPGETSKAKPRREKEGFFAKYCQGQGLDIGYGGDLLSSNCQGWDYADGNAQYLKGVPDSSFDFVYASHILEHVRNPTVAIKNWWRVLKTNGYLIVAIPERNLYEKRTRLPSHRNNDHKHFFLLENDEAPDTIGLCPFIKRTLPHYQIVYARVCGSNDEYAIEAVVKKIK